MGPGRHGMCQKHSHQQTFWPQNSHPKPPKLQKSLTKHFDRFMFLDSQVAALWAHQSLVYNKRKNFSLLFVKGLGFGENFLL